MYGSDTHLSEEVINGAFVDEMPARKTRFNELSGMQKALQTAHFDFNQGAAYYPTADANTRYG